MTADEAIAIVARHALAEAASSIRWEDYPDIGGDDWNRILTKIDGWCIFAPSGEYRESDYGDELTDDQVADWPKVRLPIRPLAGTAATLGDIEVTQHD